MSLSFYRSCWWSVLLAIWCVSAIVAQSRSEPSVAYMQGSTLRLATATGQVTKTVHTDRPVFDFAISQDLKLLVTVAQSTPYGGALDLIEADTGVRSSLVLGPVYFKHLPKGEKEVYADPEFSPDERNVAFAVHVNSQGDGNDAMDAAGPIAIVDTSTRQVLVLKSTTNIGTEAEGLCFANTPRWSSDGKSILFSCETGAFVTDVEGKNLRPLDIESDEKPWAAAIDWVGNNCVLYVQALDGGRDDTYEAGMLVLANSQDAHSSLPSLHGAISGLLEASEAVKVRRTASGLKIETASTSWTLPKDSHVHLLGGWTTGALPRECE